MGRAPRKKERNELRVMNVGPGFLPALEDAWRGLTDPTEILQRSSEALRHHFSAQRVLYLEPGKDRSFRVVVSATYSRRHPKPQSVPLLLGNGHALDALADGRSIWCNGGTSGNQRRGARAATTAAIPWIVDGRLVSVLALERAGGRWSEAELLELAEGGHRAWVAATHARAYAELEKRVDEAREEARTVFRQLVTTQERERAELARDLHDLLGQQMTAMRLAIESLRALAWPMPELAQQAARAGEIARDIDSAIDQLTGSLRSEPLESLGLSAALDHLVSSWAERNQIAADWGLSGVKDQRFDPDVEINLFRITQEALNNVLKHARATHVAVSLDCRTDRLQLIIEDNGRGIEPGVARRPPHGRFGLIGMRERAALVGGTLEIESKRGRGTTIFVHVPLRNR